MTRHNDAYRVIPLLPRVEIEEVEQIGYVLRQARRDRGDTCAAVGAGCGLGRQAIADRENGRAAFLQVESLMRHAAAVGWRLVLERSDGACTCWATSRSACPAHNVVLAGPEWADSDADT